MTIPILKPRHHWTCPNCLHEEVTHEARPHSRMHPCRGLSGLIAPMVLKGVRAGIRVHEREDYIGNDLAQLHEGRPIMSVVAERDDGEDTVVFAPVARGGFA